MLFIAKNQLTKGQDLVKGVEPRHKQMWISQNTSFIYDFEAGYFEQDCLTKFPVSGINEQ